MCVCVCVCVCVQGFAVTEAGIQLISQIISDNLGGIPCAVMMGANLAKEVANEQFCESTIGELLVFLKIMLMVI